MPKPGEVERIIPATEGQTFTELKRLWVVKPKCTTNNGHWYCITHHEMFRNQMEKDGHISRGKHVMVWWCREHDEPEVP